MSKISASTNSASPIVITGDTTGNLVFETNGNTTALTLDTSQNATFPANVTVSGTLNANIAGNGSTLTNINASNISSGTIANARTTANSSNGASTIVLRGASGEFTAGAITGSSFTGDGSALTSINASNISSGTIDNARTSAASANGASTIVARDSNGSFAGNVVTATTGSFTSVSGNGVALTAINASNVTSGTLDNARTTAATANGASTIVLRGTSGEFTAGAITGASFTGNGAAISGINASNIASGTIDNARTTAASANGASTIVARDTNGSFTANAGTFTTLSGNLTGNVTLTTGTITTNASNSTDIANKAYVDGLFSTGISYHTPVRVESPTALTVTYNQPGGAGNGVGATLTNAGAQAALVIDGVTLSVNDRVLIYTQTNQVQNGIYTVTNVGSGSTNWVMTRATDANTFGLADPSKLGQGDAVFVQQGATGAGETYICNTSGTITFGTTNITFAQISTSQIYAAGTGLNLSNLTFSIANTAVTAATYGNAGAVATFTVNAQGQITAASNAAINASSITVGTLANARTTASDANGASTIVARDANGSFTANVVTAGTGSFTSISGNGSALTAINASNISSGTIANARTTAASANGASTIVARDANGAFSAGIITADGSGLSAINASNISSGTVANARTTASSANGANTIVLRDASGDFSVDGITANWFIGDGANLSAINASNLSSGTVNTARVSGSYTGITGVGTLTAGTWNASTISAANGGTGQTSLTAENVVLGNGANAVKFVAPGTNGNVLTSNGTTWISSAATAAGVTSITGTANQIIASASTGAVTLSTPQAINTASSVQFGSFGVGTAASGTTGEIRATNNITAYFSDERLKTKVGDINNALDKVCQIETLLYHANETAVALGYDASVVEPGVIAQSVQKVQPEVVVPAPIDDKYLTVRYEKLVPLLIEAIKELKAEIDVLKGK